MIVDPDGEPRMRTPPVWAIRGDDRAVADHVASFIRSDRATRLAIAGGSTPGPILSDLAARALPWRNATLIPTDERLVSPIGRASNYGMIRDRLAPCAARVVPLAAGDEPLRLDLVWLGMGKDGKVASLFRQADCNDQQSRAVKFVRPQPLPRHAPYDRLTLTVASIVASAEIILVIRGEAKRRLVEDALAGRRGLPLAHIFAAASRPLRIFWTA